MITYDIHIYERSTTTVSVEAETEQEAIEQAQKLYYDGELTDSLEFAEVNFEI